MDLNFDSVEAMKRKPGILLLCDTSDILNADSVSDYKEIRESVEEYLNDFGYMCAGTEFEYSRGNHYVVKQTC